MSAIYDLQMTSITGEQVRFRSVPRSGAAHRQRRQRLRPHPSVRRSACASPRVRRCPGARVPVQPVRQPGARVRTTRSSSSSTSKFDVDFPMFAKIEVNGDGTAPSCTASSRPAQPGDGDSADITWNFEKFLVDRQGNVVRRFPPRSPRPRMSPRSFPTTCEPVVTGDASRWSEHDGVQRGADYDARWHHLEAAGHAIHGEADFVCRFSPVSVLDAGCGTGRVAIELAATWCRRRGGRPRSADDRTGAGQGTRADVGRG